MRSPGLAITWQLFAQYRWWWAGGLAFFAVAAVVCQVLPQGPVAFAVRYALAVPLGASGLGVLLVFAIGADRDMASRHSLYPARMFTLPVEARALVAWPMTVGTATAMAAGLAFGQLVIRSMFPAAPILGPALLLAACLAWFQAMVWLPFALRWLRLGAGLAVIVGLMALLDAVHGVDASGTSVNVTLALQLPIAYGAAMFGVARARSGSGPDWTRLFRNRGLAPSPRQSHPFQHALRRRCLSPFGSTSPFRSALEAQRWFEWRMRGPGVLVGSGIATVFMVGSTLYLGFSPLKDQLPPFAHPAALLFVPVFIAIMGGLPVGEFTCQSYASSGCPSFLATRPMDSAGFVGAKWRAAWSGVMWMCVVVTPLAILLMVCLGDYKGVDAVLAHASKPLERIAIGAAALVLLPAAAWALMIENLFVSLTGRKWVVLVLSIVGVVLFYGLLLLGAWILTSHREWLETIRTLGPWILGGLAALKLALAVWTLRALRRRRLLSREQVAWLAGCWLGVVAVLSLLLAWLVPPRPFAWPVAVSCVILAVPVVRLGLAPLALAWNRHR